MSEKLEEANKALEICNNKMKYLKNNNTSNHNNIIPEALSPDQTEIIFIKLLDKIIYSKSSINNLFSNKNDLVNYGDRFEVF